VFASVSAAVANRRTANKTARLKVPDCRGNLAARYTEFALKLIVRDNQAAILAPRVSGLLDEKRVKNATRVDAESAVSVGPHHLHGDCGKRYRQSG
jgi:hypothetical protein